MSIELLKKMARLISLPGKRGTRLLRKYLGDDEIDDWEQDWAEDRERLKKRGWRSRLANRVMPEKE